MNETLLAIYFPIWLACAIGSFLFFRRRDPAFKKRWYRRVSAFNVTVIGGMIVLIAIPISPAFAMFGVVFLLLMAIPIFQTRVCLGCGKVSQPHNLITAPEFCSKCGTGLD